MNFSGSSQKPTLLHHPALHRGILHKQFIWGPWKHSTWHSLWDPSAVLTQPTNEELLSVTPLEQLGIITEQHLLSGKDMELIRRIFAGGH